MQKSLKAVAVSGFADNGVMFLFTVVVQSVDFARANAMRDVSVVPKVTVPEMNVNATVSKVDGVLWVEIDAEYQMHTIYGYGDSYVVENSGMGLLADPSPYVTVTVTQDILEAHYPFPFNVTNFSVKVDGEVVEWQEDTNGFFHIFDADLSEINWTVAPVPRDFVVTVHYEQSISKTSEVYEYLGDNTRALECNSEALVLSKEAGNTRDEGINLMSMGCVYMNLEEYDLALDHLSRAREIFSGIENRRNLGRALGYIGLTHIERGEYHAALEPLEESLRISIEIGETFGQGHALNNLGDAHYEIGDFSASKEFFRRALDVGEEFRMPVTVWRAHAGLAANYSKGGEHTIALGHYEHALQSIEAARRDVPLEELKWLFLERQIGVYEDIVFLLLQVHQEDRSRGFDERAFMCIERAKARSFLDILAESRVGIRRGADPALLSEERKVLANISRIQNRLRDGGLSDDQRMDPHRIGVPRQPLVREALPKITDHGAPPGRQSDHTRAAKNQRRSVQSRCWLGLPRGRKRRTPASPGPRSW